MKRPVLILATMLAPLLTMPSGAAAAVHDRVVADETAVSERARGTVVAQSCLSQKQARQAVQQGQAQPLSRLIGGVRAQVGGEILPNPQMCRSGGRLVYLVSVLMGNGSVRQVVVDAATGAVQ